MLLFIQYFSQNILRYFLHTCEESQSNRHPRICTSSNGRPEGNWATNEAKLTAGKKVRNPQLFWIKQTNEPAFAIMALPGSDYHSTFTRRRAPQAFSSDSVRLFARFLLVTLFANFLLCRLVLELILCFLPTSTAFAYISYVFFKRFCPHYSLLPPLLAFAHITSSCPHCSRLPRIFTH